MFVVEDYLKVGKIKNDLFLAKTDESILTHTKNVLNISENLIETYGKYFTKKEIELLKIACQVHDYGKINSLFQTKILKKETTIDGEINHNFLSPIFLDIDKLKDKYSDNEIKNLITSIYYHHTREEKNQNILKYYEDYMQENVYKCFEKAMVPSINYLQKCLFSYPNDRGDDFEWCSYAKLKGLLQKCDYAGSAGIKQLEIKNIEKRKYFINNIHNKIIKEFNSNLNEMQLFMQENQDQNLIIIAPTGIGKTEGSFLWADLDKTFYTLPLKVASNAIYERAKNNYCFEDITILHSESLEMLVKDNLEDRYEITKNLGYPLTITTIDQLFKFPFKALGHEILFATLTYSKVIIDEIQMYSSSIIACILVGLKYLIQNGGKFAITTATLPPIFIELFNKILGIANNEVEKYYKLKSFSYLETRIRHCIKLYDEDFNYDQILKEGKKSKVLVICNTVKKAQTVFDNLKDNDLVVNLLHSKFIKKDRRDREDKILKYMDNGIWITTQIVEASLDIDFDILHTELSTPDSLFQRMGRCYRKRSLENIEPNIFIYNTKNGLKKDGKKGIYDEQIYDITWNELLNYNEKILTENDKEQIINKIYSREFLNNSFYLKDLENKIKELQNFYPGKFSKKEIDIKFRDIHDITVIPDEVYNENLNEIISLIDQYKMEKGKNKMNIKTELMQYTLQIPSYFLKKYNNPLIKDMIYLVPLKYSKEKGLIYEEYNDQFS